MKSFLIALILTWFAAPLQAQTFISRNGKISFYSEAPLENIEAHNSSVNGVVNTVTKTVFFKAPIRQFEFAKQLMKEHFNENYLESDKYPDAEFKGKINETVDLTKDGTYDVTATGKLKIHGVEQDRTEKGKIIVKGNTLRLICDMKVRVADFKIEIPQLVFQNIAEVVDVKIDIPLVPYVKEEKK